MRKQTQLSKQLLKKLPEALDQVQQAAPEATVELWSTDEHRIGLKPILRRVWVFNGQRPTASVEHRYQWLYVYAFVHPPSGHTQWLLLPTVNVDIFALALQHFAQAVGASKQNRSDPFPHLLSLVASSQRKTLVIIRKWYYAMRDTLDLHIVVGSIYQ